MMLDRLRVADLKDEIVSMQAELNNALFEQHQKSQMTIKTETVAQPQPNQTYPHPIPMSLTTTNQQSQIQPQVVQNPPLNARPQPNVCIMSQEPSQILKAKQEQKLHENIKNDRIKIEIPEVKTSFISSQSVVIPCSPSPSLALPPKQSKFDKLKNESLNVVVTTHLVSPSSQQSLPQLLSPNIKKSHINTKAPVEFKQELDDFDIESEIRPNLIMKKYESAPSPGISHNTVTSKKQNKPKEKDKEREFSPLNEYFNAKNLPKASKSESVKSESNDGSYDEWLSIQKELNNQLTTPSHSLSSKKEEGKCIKPQAKLLENDLSDIFEHHTSPKSVEKQLDDLFSSTSNKSNDLLANNSPLTEFFHIETSNINEKSVENRLEALFGTSEEDSRKSNQQDLVETRLEQLFQGSVAENDESALDNASFLYKSTDLTYDMIQKQIHVSTSSVDNDNGNASNANKRQWSGACDMFASNNSSILFPAPSSPSSKRACTAGPSVAFDSKWIEDSFDFASEIMSTESSEDDITKHRSWNGNLDHSETMIGGIQSPHQSQFHLPSSDGSNIQQHQNPTQNLQQTEPHLNLMERQEQMMESQISNYDDVDDISRQVQNAIDSILNLQSSDPLHYQLDSSFLELNTITDPSASSPNASVSMQPSHSHQVQTPQNLNQQYQMHPRSDNQINPHSFSSQKTINMPKRKYSRMDDIGDCLIGGSNLDDSPSGLALPEAHSVDQSSACVGEFVNNLLNCEEKSITTS